MSFHHTIRPALLACTALVSITGLTILLPSQPAWACVNGGAATVNATNCIVESATVPTTVTFATSPTGSLILNGASPTGAINATTAGQGNITVQASTTLAAGATIGATTGVGNITVNSSQTLNASNVSTINANNVIVGGSNATLILGNTTLTATGRLDAAGSGDKLVVAGNATVNGVIGTINGIDITVNDGASLTTNSSTYRATTVLGSGSGADATLTLSGTTSVQGWINGNSAGRGNLVIDGNATLASGIRLGSTNALNSLTINSGNTLDARNATTISANTITVGAGGGNGTLTLGNTSVTANSGLDGAGGAGNIVVVDGDATITGNIGNGNGIDLRVNDGKSLTTNSSIYRATTVLGSAGGGGAALTLNGTTSVRGSINGDAAGNGTLVINGNATLDTGTNVGNTNSLAQISINTGKILDATNAATLAATKILVGETGKLILGNTSVTGAVNSVFRAGTVEVAGNATINGTIGDTLGVNLIVKDGASLTTNSSTITASTVLGSGSGGQATLTLSGTTTLKSWITGNSSGRGNLVVDGNVTFASGGIGDTYTNKTLNSVVINSGQTLDMRNGSSLIANNITVGADTGSGAGNGTLILGATLVKVTGNLDGAGGSGNIIIVDANNAAIAGNIGTTNGIDMRINDGKSLITQGNVRSTIQLGSGSGSNGSMTMQGTGTLQGVVRGSAAGHGILTIAGAITSSADIGDTNSLAQLNIDSGKSLDASAVANIAATKVVLSNSSTLTLGNTTLTGTVSGYGTVAVAGNATIAGAVSGSFSSGSSMLLRINDGQSLTVTGNVTSNVTLGDAGGAHATLTLQGSAFSSMAVRGYSNLRGDLVIDNNMTGVASSLGLNGNSLRSITVNAGRTVQLVNTALYASSLTLNTSSALQLTSGTVYAPIDGAADGDGALMLIGRTTLGSSIGATHALGSVVIGNGSTASSLDLNWNIAADSITLRDDAALTGPSSGSKSLTGPVTLNKSTLSLYGGNINATNGVTVASGKTATVQTYLGTGANILDITGGTLTLSDATSTLNVNATLIGRVANDSDKYLIINNANAAVLNGGTIANTSGGGLVTWVARVATAGDAGTDVYGTTIDVGQDVVLVANVKKAAELPLDKDVVKVIDSLPTNPTDPKTVELVAAVQNLTSTSELTKAGNQLKPETGRGSVEAAVSSTAQALSVVGNRASSLRTTAMLDRLDNRGGGSGATGISSGDVREDRGMWGEAFGAMARQGYRGTSDGYDSSTAGFAAGADMQATEALRLGLAGSYSQTWMDEKGARSANGNDISSYGAILYSSYNADTWYLDSSVGVALHRYQGQRGVNFTGFQGIARNKHDGIQYTAKTEAGYAIRFGATTLTPLANLTWTRLNQEAYTETGSTAANLSIDSTSNDSVTSGLGAKVSHQFATRFGILVPELRATWLREFRDEAPITTARFASGGSSFTSEGNAPARNGAVIGAGLTLMANDSYELSANLDIELRDQYVGQSGRLRLRSRF